MIYSHHTRYGIYISYRPFTRGIRQKITLRDELIIISYRFYQNWNCTMEEKVVESWVFLRVKSCLLGQRFRSNEVTKRLCH